MAQQTVRSFERLVRDSKRQVYLKDQAVAMHLWVPRSISVKQTLGRLETMLETHDLWARRRGWLPLAKVSSLVSQKWMAAGSPGAIR